jgi:hypothetical protein
MDHFLEDKNIKVAKDTKLYDKAVKAGAKITILSKQGVFNGFKMRVPPPEYESLFIDLALESAAKAEEVKKIIEISKSTYDGLYEVGIDGDNYTRFFRMCQNAMAAVTFAISALESWANKSIAIYGIKEGKPIELTIERPDKPVRKVMSDTVASDLSIPIRPKIFQLIPQVFNAEQLKYHSSLKKELGNIIDERNIIMHMQQKLTLSNNEEFERSSYAIKLYKINAFIALEIVLNYMNYIYGKSNIDEALWITYARKKLKSLRRCLK